MQSVDMTPLGGSDMAEVRGSGVLGAEGGGPDPTTGAVVGEVALAGLENGGDFLKSAAESARAAATEGARGELDPTDGGSAQLWNN